MKKLLYYTTKDMTDSGVGINNKIREQIECFEKNGYAVDAVYRRNEKELVIKRKGLEHILKTLQIRPYKVLSSAILSGFVKKQTYDAVYIRYVYCDREFLRLLKECRKNCQHVAVEIPTYPYDEELKGTLENKVLLLLDRIYRQYMRKYVDRIITFSEDTEIFGIPTIRTMNGLNFENVPVARRDQEYMDRINLIAVAAHAMWHGYDRILAGLAEYYNRGGERNILFHVVGEGPELERYKQMVCDNNLDEHVTFYGTLRGEALDKVYNMCDIAAASFGFHRIGLTLASNLKSREYAAKGLPVVSGVDIDIFNGKLSKYCCKVPYDDSPVDMNVIVSFYDRIYANKTHEEVADEIRSIAASICSMDAVMQPILEFYEDGVR